MDFEHPTCKGKSNKQQVRPYFCPYRARGVILWYPGRCPGLGTGCPFRALAARVAGALHGLKAQQVRSPGQRPGLTYVPHRRPVRAKVINNRLPILLPLQGEGLYTLVPRALPWAEDWLPFQGARGAIRHYFPSAATKFVNSINSLLRRLRPNIFRCNNEAKYPSPSKVLALNPSAPSEDGYFYADIFPGPALEEERQFIVVSAVEKFLGGIAVVRRGA